MKIKLAKVSITVHEVQCPGICPHCKNVLTAYDSDMIHVDFVKVGREDHCYLDAKKDMTWPIHESGFEEVTDRYATTISCGQCGNEIVGKDSILEPLSEKEREHLKYLAKQLMED